MDSHQESVSCETLGGLKFRCRPFGSVAHWYKENNWNSRWKRGFCTVLGVGMSRIHSTLSWRISYWVWHGWDGPQSPAHTAWAHNAGWAHQPWLPPFSVSRPTYAKTQEQSGSLIMSKAGFCNGYDVQLCDFVQDSQSLASCFWAHWTGLGPTLLLGPHSSADYLSSLS